MGYYVLFADYQPRRLGRYNVLYSGRALILELDVFCCVDRGKYRVLLPTYLVPYCVSIFAGYQPRWLGKYNVFYTRYPFVLGLDIFCSAHCGK